jgi:hypothetical protein
MVAVGFKGGYDGRGGKGWRRLAVCRNRNFRVDVGGFKGRRRKAAPRYRRVGDEAASSMQTQTMEGKGEEDGKLKWSVGVWKRVEEGQARLN